MKSGIKNALTSIVLASAVALTGCSTLNNNQRDRVIEYSIDSWKNHTDTAMKVYGFMEKGMWKEAKELLDEELECRPETGPMYNAHLDMNSGQYDEAQSWMKEYLGQQKQFGREFNNDVISGKVPNGTAVKMIDVINEQVKKINESLR